MNKGLQRIASVALIVYLIWTFTSGSSGDPRTGRNAISWIDLTIGIAIAYFMVKFAIKITDN